MKMFSDERKEMREEQKEMRAVFQRENAELRAQNDKQAQEIKQLHKKLHNQDKHLHEKLRQRDEEEGPRLEAKIRNAITEERHSSDLENVVKKLINSEINNFLTSKD